MLYEIRNAVARPDHTVAITWDDGASGVVDFAPFIMRGALFEALKEPSYFVSKMTILRGGLGLPWPNEVDFFFADGLRRDAFPEERAGEYDEVAGRLKQPPQQQPASR
jgi:hypothetical protein